MNKKIKKILNIVVKYVPRGIYIIIVFMLLTMISKTIKYTQSTDLEITNNMIFNMLLAFMLMYIFLEFVKQFIFILEKLDSFFEFVKKLKEL